MVKKIVVIGGGFAGSHISRKFDKDKDFQVTLVDNKDYFEFTPSIVKVLSAPEHLKKIQKYHKDYLKNSEIIIGDLTDIIPDNKEIEVKHESKTKKIKYDYLVICSGSTYSQPFKEKNLVLPVRGEHLLEFNKILEDSKNVLIVGGGLVGVEITGEISQNYKDKEVTIVHSNEVLMERMSVKSQVYSKKVLEKRNVKILFKEKVVKNNKEIYITDKGTKIKSDICFICTGIIPNYEFMKKHLDKSLDKRDLIIVNENLQINDFKNIFSAGDINSIAEEKTAQNAEMQAKIVVKNIKRVEKNKELKKYVSTPKIMVISIGKYNGIMMYKNYTITGIIPAFVKWFVEKKEMMKF